MASGDDEGGDGAPVLVESAGLGELVGVVAGVLEVAVAVGPGVVAVVELRSITPALAPLIEAWVAPVPLESPESEPPAPQADKATQHASADTADPRERCIDGSEGKLIWTHFARDWPRPQCLGSATTCLYLRA